MSFVKRCLSAVRAFRPAFSPFLRFVDQREPDRPRHLSRFVFAPFITFISQTVSQLAQHEQYLNELTGVLGSVATQSAAMSTQQGLIAAPPREAVLAFLQSNRAFPSIVVAPLRNADHRVQKMLTATASPDIEIGEINVQPFAALHHLDPSSSAAVLHRLMMTILLMHELEHAACACFFAKQLRPVGVSPKDAALACGQGGWDLERRLFGGSTLVLEFPVRQLFETEHAQSVLFASQAGDHYLLNDSQWRAFTADPAAALSRNSTFPTFPPSTQAPSVEADMVRASGGQWGQSPPPTPYTARVGFSVRGLGGRAPDPSTRY